MFKVGDKVKLIRGCEINYVYVQLNKVYTIVKLFESENSVYLELNIEENEYYSPHRYNLANFQLCKPKITNELQWLDAVQQNFKEGI